MVAIANEEKISTPVKLVKHELRSSSFHFHHSIGSVRSPRAIHVIHVRALRAIRESTMSSHSTEKKDPFHIEYKRAPLTKRNLERYNDQAKSKEYIDKVAALAVDLIYDSAGNEIDVRKDIQKLLQVHRVRSVAVDEGLLDGLANAIRDDRVQGLFMQDALDFIMEALSETIEFEFKRYPEIFAMILAFGVSVLIDDGMTVRAIGFGETGPVKGSQTRAFEALEFD